MFRETGKVIAYLISSRLLFRLQRPPLLSDLLPRIDWGGDLALLRVDFGRVCGRGHGRPRLRSDRQEGGIGRQTLFARSIHGMYLLSSLCDIYFIICKRLALFLDILNICSCLFSPFLRMKIILPEPRSPFHFSAFGFTFRLRCSLFPPSVVLPRINRVLHSR